MTYALSIGTTELAVGLIQGLCYALLGLGLVLIYRASGVIHFGYGEIGAFGAVVLAKLVLDYDWPWLIALTFVVLCGATISAFWELVVVRRLADSPRLMLLVATIAIAQLMLVAQLLLPNVENQDLYPTAFEFSNQIGSFTLRGDHVVVILVVPILGLALGWFLSRTITGLSIRGSAANRDAASLAGVRVKRVSTIVWALAGALATLTFVLILPVRGFVFGASTAALGPALLLRGLVVGLIGRMQSLPQTVVGGIAFGIVETILLSNVDSPGAVDMMVFVLLVVLLLVRGGAAAADAGQAFASSGLRLAKEVRESRLARRLPRYILGAALMTAVALPILFDNPARQFTFTRILVFALAGLSVTIITGWAGQLSLCQFAFVGISGFAVAGLTARGVGFVPALVLAVVLTAAVAVAIGFPALRIKGLYLSMITLGFAIGTRAWLLPRTSFQGPGGQYIVTRGQFGPLDLDDGATYYFVCLVILVVVASAIARLRNTGIGLAIIAVRENEPAAGAVTLSPSAVKLVAFGLSGAVAGLAGALLGGLAVNLNPNDFGPEQSILLLTMTIIGGVGSVAGSLLGALYVIGVPNLFAGSTLATLLTGGVGLLVLVLWIPGGLLEVAQRAFAAYASRRGFGHPAGDDGLGGHTAAFDHDDAPEVTAQGARRIADLPLGPRARPPSAETEWALACEQVEVTFGGLVANAEVDLRIAVGETVGLIGTNGAGKSTLMNAVAGTVPTSHGRIVVFGHDVTGLPAHVRAELGIGRVFQDARLFGQLSVVECVTVALEARRHSEVLPSILALPPARRDERRKRSVAREIVDLCGLGDYAEHRVAELSTGTRRICELACLVAGGGQLILLDEPTAGVAQREVEAFGKVIKQIQSQLDATVVLIEHDMPLVMSLSDRVVCMSAGRVIADGTPAEVRDNPGVIAAYLGTDERSISRSDMAVTP